MKLHYFLQKWCSVPQKTFLGIFFLCPLFLLCVAIGIQVTHAETNSGDILSTDNEASTETNVLRNQITQKNTDLENLKKQIDSYEKQLIFTQSEAKTLQNTVKSLDLDRQKISTGIQLTQKKLEASALTLAELNMNISETEEKIKATHKAISEILRTIDRADSKTTVEIVLSGNNLSDIMDERMQLMQLREQINGRTKELVVYENNMVAQKGEVEIEKKKLGSYKADLTDQKIVLDNSKKEKNNLLAITRDRESDYQKILNMNKAKAEAFEKELSDYNSKLTRLLDKKRIPTIGSKILSWPLAKPFITQHFGITQDSVRLYASGTHNGIDLRASRGTPINSSAKGEIVATGDTDTTCPKASYGKWILIRHDNGLTTLFAHLDVIKASSGQVVENGDLIGYSGNTGYSTGPHLHVSVFASDGVQVGSFASKTCTGKVFMMPLPTAKNAFLDPEGYFPNL